MDGIHNEPVLRFTDVYAWWRARLDFEFNKIGKKFGITNHFMWLLHDTLVTERGELDFVSRYTKIWTGIETTVCLLDTEGGSLLIGMLNQDENLLSEYARELTAYMERGVLQVLK